MENKIDKTDVVGTTIITLYIIAALNTGLGFTMSYHDDASMSVPQKVGLSILAGVLNPAIALIRTESFFDGLKPGDDAAAADDALGKAVIQVDGATISHCWGDDNWLEVWRLTGDGGNLVLEAPDGERWNLTDITGGKATPEAFGLGGSDD